MSSWQDNECVSSPGTAAGLCDGASPGQGRPAYPHLILRCLYLPRSKVLCTLMGMWEASASPTSVLHDLLTLSLYSISFPQSFLASSFQKKFSFLSWLNSRVKDCPGDRGRNGRGWELAVYTSLSLYMEGFRGTGSQCLVNTYYESSSFTNNLVSHIMKLRLREVKSPAQVTCP